MSVIRLPLGGKAGQDRVALIDEADAHLAAFRWYYDNHNGDVRRRTWPGNRSLRLHREVLGLTQGDGLEGDHINGDKLDNRRENLRITTRAQNAQNVAPQRGRSSKYRGVSLCTQTGRWRAYATIAGRRTYLGRFVDEKAADAAVRVFREQHMSYTNEAREALADSRLIEIAAGRARRERERSKPGGDPARRPPRPSRRDLAIAQRCAL